MDAQALLNTPIRTYFSWRKKRIESIRNQAIERQQEWFAYLLHHGSNSCFGKEHALHSKMNYSDFVTAIPVQDYNSLFPYIERILSGENFILWDTPIQWMAKSSGTTQSKSKFIPVSKESLWVNNYLSAQDTMTAYCLLFPHTKLFAGKGLMLGGSFQKTTPHPAIQIGDVSAILLQNMPNLGDFLKASNRETLLCDNWQQKLVLLSKTSLKQNVTSLSGVPSWILLVLKEVLQMTGKQQIFDVWKNLELFMHGGVSFAPYLEEYKKILPGNQLFYMNVYNASEGFFGFQDQKESDELLLLTNNGIFYEFAAVSQAGKTEEQAIPLWEVKPDVEYAMLISTAAGLWRYLIGDTIRFTSTRPYRFRITGRTRHYINAFGEELIVENADKALAATCRQTGAAFTDYTAAPVYLGSNTAKACHEWVIEFTTPPPDLGYFTYLLDKELQNLNSDYEAKRSGELLLNMPKIHVAPIGTFVRWLEKNNKLGGQYKVPRLQNHRQILNEILDLI